MRRNGSTIRTVCQAYGNWLSSLKCDWFVTLTFADTANDYRAKRAAEVWFYKLHQVYCPSAMVYVIEPHPLRPEAHHIHGLIKFADTLVEPWRNIGAVLWRWGYVRILPANERAGTYVSKYIAHKDVVYWDVLGDTKLLTLSNEAVTIGCYEHDRSHNEAYSDSVGGLRSLAKGSPHSERTNFRYSSRSSGGVS